MSSSLAFTFGSEGCGSDGGPGGGGDDGGNEGGGGDGDNEGGGGAGDGDGGVDGGEGGDEGGGTDGCVVIIVALLHRGRRASIAKATEPERGSAPVRAWPGATSCGCSVTSKS